MTKNKKTRAHAKPRKGIWLIVVFKLLKGAMLLAVGIGALSLLHEDVAARVTHWIEAKKLVEVSAGTFFYAALVLTEGIGLALHRKWAEYFTTFVTASLIPLEVYELVQKFSFMKTAVIAVNIAVVVYLAVGLRETKA